MEKQPSALVTGASGFIGKYVARELRDAGYDVSTLSRSEDADFRCDLAQSVPDFSGRRFCLVAHVAGTADNASADAVNRQGTENLAKGLAEAHPEAFVFISSASVYGITEGENIDESHPLAPVTDYGRSKLAAEQFLTEWTKRNAVRLTVLRPVMVVGTGMTGQLMTMARGIDRGTYFNIKGNTARRSVVHAIDVARAVRLLAEAGASGAFNVTDGVDSSLIDLAEAFAVRIKGKRIADVPARWIRLAARFGDLLKGHFPIDSSRLDKITKTLTFDSSRLRAAIEWQPIDVVDYLRTHDYENDGLEF
ncbi:MAG: NAD-dependent epimerase/dehydratase family protein [Muribaculaceae bacterium]|nr:NAD-dependent epimerase/dehydratase family protein [Muribaculaceae bacterium]